MFDLIDASMLMMSLDKYNDRQRRTVVKTHACNLTIKTEILCIFPHFPAFLGFLFRPVLLSLPYLLFLLYLPFVPVATIKSMRGTRLVIRVCVKN